MGHVDPAVGPATTVSTAEYDAFGPWIDPVRTLDEVPRLFRGHGVRPDEARLVLKVPRDVPRRDLTPDMDLYDHLLVAGEDALTVLSRRGTEVDVAVLPYRRVAAVRTSVDLLDGRLTVLGQDGEELRVRFSGSSSAAVEALVDLLRAAAWPAAGATRGAPPAGPAGLLDRGALGDRELGLLTVYREALRDEPGVRTLAAHPRQAVLPLTGGPARLAHLLRPMTLHAQVVCSDGAGLQVFGRVDPLVRGRTPDHSWSRLSLPLRAVTGARSTPDPRYAGVSTVTLALGRARVALPVPTGSPVEAALLRRG